MAEAELARLRGAAKIEYIDKKYAAIAGTNASTPATKPAEQEKQITATEPTNPADVAKSPGNGKVESHIEKGLSGL